MKINHGAKYTPYGPGVVIDLTGDQVAQAIDAWLVAHGVYVSGPRSVSVNGQRIECGQVFVDPMGHATYKGATWQGRGPGFTTSGGGGAGFTGRNPTFGGGPGT